MSRILKAIGVSEERPLGPATLVERNSRVVCALLVKGLNRKIKTADFWKILVHLNSSIEEGRAWENMGVLTVHRTFPSAQFADWPPAKRGDFLLAFVAGVVRKVFVENSLDVSKLDEAVAYAERSQFHNVMVGKRKYRNVATQTVAHIECDQELDESRIYIVLKHGREQRRLFVTTAPTNEFQLQMYFGKVEWQDDGTPALVKLQGERLPVSYEG
jgi:hypothetical protein